MRETCTVPAQLTVEVCDYCAESQEIDLRIRAREYCPNTGTRWPRRFTTEPRNGVKLACNECIESGAYLEGTSGELPGQWNLKGPGSRIFVALLPLDTDRALLLRDSIMHWWTPASQYDAMSSVYELVHWPNEPIIKFSVQHQRRIELKFARKIGREEIAQRLGEHVVARMSEKRSESIEVAWSLIVS